MYLFLTVRWQLIQNFTALWLRKVPTWRTSWLMRLNETSTDHFQNIRLFKVKLVSMRWEGFLQRMPSKTLTLVCKLTCILYIDCILHRKGWLLSYLLLLKCSGSSLARCFGVYIMHTCFLHTHTYMWIYTLFRISILKIIRFKLGDKIYLDDGLCKFENGQFFIFCRIQKR